MTETTLHPPAEWAPHAAIWTAWPADEELWLDNLAPAQAEVAAMVKALAAPGPDGRPGDKMKVLVHGPTAMLSAEKLIGEHAELIDAQYGDIWLRDTGPIFYSNDRCALFTFNGWGGKYVLDHDDIVGAFVAIEAGANATRWDRVLEGGALDWDGEGTILTTRECLLNPNRNPLMSEMDVKAMLHDALGVAHGDMDRAGPAERPHRRPCRQHCALPARPALWPARRRLTRMIRTLSGSTRSPCSSRTSATRVGVSCRWCAFRRRAASRTRMARSFPPAT